MMKLHDPATRSLPRTVLLTTAVLAVVFPLVQWMAALIFRDPIPPGPVWVRYVGVMAVAGVCMGLAIHATARRPRGWPHIFVNAWLILLVIGGDIEDFASESLDRFLLKWVVVSVITALVVGSMIHAFAGKDEPRPADGPG